ncbi:aminopeptidase N-like isoform X2 [Ruditapes philippinarum]|uniref:aminopeptidase N-like isoform X2 n=1 Tax=Ruditapes philippinarum TaxID=129788 RepID=UPI00295BD2BB|nr:aminopeptidase N-like isoform X2 [Ruditapes philippinarum]
MDGIHISKRSALLLLIVCVVSLCGTAVAFYFIGAAQNDTTGSKTTVEKGANKSTNKDGNLGDDGRLPRHIEPILYKIELFPDIYGTRSSEFTLSGSVWIKFKCIEKSANITLNINKLTLNNSSMKAGKLLATNEETYDGIEILTYEINTKWQFLIIYLKEDIRPGNQYFVCMNFTGTLQTDFAGMYLSRFPYRTVNQYVAATQFSPTDARKAYPCLDEPDRKAQFEITLVRRNDMVSLSNMPIMSTVTRGLNFVADIYQRTPKMPTYLTAMAVGDLDSITRPARTGLDYTSWAGKETINKTKHALEFGAKILSFFENYFGISFPLPKQDILAVPETSVGAMENWGLIIFNQNRIFYEEGEYSLNHLMQSSVTISHELAHQWFGNLVSMNWWSDLFLKEGFAVYFSDVGISNVYPDWNFMDQFAVRNIHSVFDDDGLVSSHPVYKKLADTTEIRQVFDSISYTKGGCMIRMLNFILGDADFQDGLKRYLQNYKYSSVGHADLWKAVEPNPLKQYHPPGVGQVMDTWILQKNYPVITIRQVKPGLLKITQERFLNNPSEAVNDTEISPFNYVWKIPLTYTCSSNTSFSVTNKDIIWMEEKVLMIADREIINLTLPGNWIIANLKQWGYYRVNYEETIWKNLIKQLMANKAKIDLVNRAQIINDLFSLSKAKMVELKLALTVFEYLRFEDEYVPWLAALKEITYIDKLIANIEAYDAYKEIMKHFIQTIYKNLELNKGSLTMEQNLLRSKVYSLACTLDMTICIKQSVNEFSLWKNRNDSLDVNTRSTVLCSALKEGNDTDWVFVLQKYNTTLNINEKYSYLRSLACTQNKDLQKRLLNLCGDQYTIQGRDIGSTLMWLAQNPSATTEVWDYVKSNWQRFLDTFAGSLFLLSSLVSGVTEPFTTTEQLRDLEQFIAETPDLGPAEQTFKQAVEATKSKILWLTENQVTVENWITEMSGKYNISK